MATKLTDAQLGKLAREAVLKSDPWIEGSMGWILCFYCGADEAEQHADDCLFVLCGGPKESFDENRKRLKAAA